MVGKRDIGRSAYPNGDGPCIPVDKSPSDQQNTRCWEMTVARGPEMKAPIQPLMPTAVLQL
jgi:hypothetical protein